MAESSFTLASIYGGYWIKIPASYKFLESLEKLDGMYYVFKRGIKFSRDFIGDDIHIYIECKNGCFVDHYKLLVNIEVNNFLPISYPIRTIKERHKEDFILKSLLRGKLRFTEYD